MSGQCHFGKRGGAWLHMCCSLLGGCGLTELGGRTGWLGFFLDGGEVGRGGSGGGGRGDTGGAADVSSERSQHRPGNGEGMREEGGAEMGGVMSDFLTSLSSPTPTSLMCHTHTATHSTHFSSWYLFFSPGCSGSSIS